MPEVITRVVFAADLQPGMVIGVSVFTPHGEGGQVIAVRRSADETEIGIILDVNGEQRGTTLRGHIPLPINV